MFFKQYLLTPLVNQSYPKAIFKIISGICASIAHRRFLFEYASFVKDKYTIKILHTSQILTDR